MRQHKNLLAALAASCSITSLLSTPFAAASEVEYGVDISFPMQSAKVSNNYAWLPHNTDPENNPTPEEYKNMPIQHLGDRNAAYDEFLQGCRDFYGKKGRACDATEDERIAMSVRQPQSMMNYTEIGFKKIRAPENVFKLIKEFWEKNKNTQKAEKWFSGNTYTNHWKAPTYMVSVEDTSLRGGGSYLKQQIWDAARETIQGWTGQELTQCSLYGIRVYVEGAILASHVDRLPLVSSAIINVAQDLDEPWPLEVIGHDGKAYNVTMEPGDMVLYESHAIIHGRPFPLKGRYYANVFIHFEPTGHSLEHHGIDFGSQDVNEKYAKDAKKGISGHENKHHGLPVYVMENSPEESHWLMQHPNAWQPTKAANADFTTGSTDAHTAAADGNVALLKEIAEKDIDKIHAVDANGWQPFHEGARGGHVDVVKLLLDLGADKDKRTGKYENGGSALWWAKKHHGDSHPVVKFLKSINALNIGPEL